MPSRTHLGNEKVGECGLSIPRIPTIQKSSVRYLWDRPNALQRGSSSHSRKSCVAIVSIYQIPFGKNQCPPTNYAMPYRRSHPYNHNRLYNFTSMGCAAIGSTEVDDVSVLGAFTETGVAEVVVVVAIPMTMDWDLCCQNKKRQWRTHTHTHRNAACCGPWIKVIE